jgi:hypothetical protein
VTPEKTAEAIRSVVELVLGRRPQYRKLIGPIIAAMVTIAGATLVFAAVLPPVVLVVAGPALAVGNLLAVYYPTNEPIAGGEHSGERVVGRITVDQLAARIGGAA